MPFWPSFPTTAPGSVIRVWSSGFFKQAEHAATRSMRMPFTQHASNWLRTECWAKGGGGVARCIASTRRAKLRVPCSYINVTPDVVISDLLKTSGTDQAFSLTGLPDVKLKPAGRRDDGEP